MTSSQGSRNRVREVRLQLGLSQAELASRAGISRTAVTAIEGLKLVPSVASALALARALNTQVETLFSADSPASNPDSWAFAPRNEQMPFTSGRVNKTLWKYPLTLQPTHCRLPDSHALPSAHSSADDTIVIATCDPAAGLLATLYEQATGMRMTILPRSSGESLELLRLGKVHCAGIHYSNSETPEQNAATAAKVLSIDFQLLHLAKWSSGIAIKSSSRVNSIRNAVKAKLTWVWREPGACAHASLARLLGTTGRPRRVALGHWAVANIIQTGWGDAGVCVEAVSAEHGLDFLHLSDEIYELCITSNNVLDRRIQALVKVVRSRSYIEMLNQLPGYSAADAGNINEVPA